MLIMNSLDNSGLDNKTILFFFNYKIQSEGKI